MIPTIYIITTKKNAAQLFCPIQKLPPRSSYSAARRTMKDNEINMKNDEKGISFFGNIYFYYATTTSFDLQGEN